MTDAPPDPDLGAAEIYFEDHFEAANLKAAYAILRERIAQAIGPVPSDIVARVAPLHLQVEPGSVAVSIERPAGWCVTFTWTATAQIHLEGPGVGQVFFASERDPDGVAGPFASRAEAEAAMCAPESGLSYVWSVASPGRWPR